ncbi:SDR family oxidoreductase [Paludibaculum fermentans]|uniref:SDR family oxidoreductase n=1 Tax=Paludibaculum fermentans TaxID=1473598 RepID=A0A7S7NKY9_PALFE|nr:SDR family oxidoreductase [Paludibaculum fermentans]QOY85474.1 SDR family oxidoreductase [Paludibaculum fermentans]
MSLQRLSGKTAIVTGAARGIGRAIASSLASEGARVVVNYTRSAAEAEALAAEIGGLAIQADVSVVADIRRLFETAEAALGPLDILVNNAGVASFQPVAQSTEEQYDHIFSVNARGTYFCCREAALRLRNGGRIVSISTGATVSSPAGSAIYSGSKAAVEQLTRALARELGPRSITVNTVSPGFTDTDMLNQFPTLVGIAAGMSPLGRVGQPADVAEVVAWLCTSEARWVTGQNLQAGGGASMV